MIDYVGASDKADELARALELVGGSATAVAADVSDPEQVDMLIQHAVTTFGRLDIFVNNAGIEHEYPFLETPKTQWDKVIAVNLTGPFLCSQRAANVQPNRWSRKAETAASSTCHPFTRTYRCP